MLHVQRNPMRRGFRRFCAALALAASAILCAHQLPAPPGVFAFRSYGSGEGLSNLSVNALAQDDRGFLWIGTEDGLFRLEGAQMRRFGVQEGLPDASIESFGLGAAANGGLWVVTRKGTVLWKDGRFLAPSALGAAGWDGKLGIALASGGVILNDGQNRRSLLRDNGRLQALPGLPQVRGMTSAWQSRDGRELLVLVAGRLYRRFDGAWSSRDLAPAMKGNLVCVLGDRRGRIWVRSERSLVRLATLEGPLEDLSGRLELSISNTGGLVEDALGRIWTNTAGSLAWYDEDAAGLLSEANGLPQGGANVLLVDRENSLWIGGEGVHRQLGRFAWEGYTRRQGLPAHVVWSLHRSRDGLLWAGTAAGVAVGDGRRWEPVPGTAQRQFMSFAEDQGGSLWMAPTLALEEPPWLLQRRPPGRAPVRVPLPALKPGTSVAALAPGPEGGLWVGTDQAGLHRFQHRGAGWALLPEPVPGWPPEGVGVSHLHAPAPEELWAATSRGLAHFDGRQWRTLGKDRGLEDDDLLSVVAGRGGEAWVAYRTVRALSRVRLVGPDLKLVETLRPPHPLLGHPVSSLALDPSGALWLGTSLGVLRWDGRRVERFGKAWGLAGEDCAQNALWLDPGGDAWFGLSVGIARFHADRHRVAEPIPGVLIQQVLDGQGAALADAARVPWGRRTVAFEYLADSYVQGETPKFQVRLLGLEDNWRDTPLPEARYPNLPAGRYRFEVRLLDGVGGAGPAAGVGFTIVAPWWQTWMFRLLALGGLLAALLAGYRWRTDLLRRRNEDLERVVRTRTAALAQANRALEEMSMGDPLTHLRNRRYLGITMPEEAARVLRVFQSHLQRGEWPRGQDEDMLLLMVDLDRFKAVNDRFGHRAGDEVLRQTGELLREVCRESDTLVRWGGEEFLVIAKRSNRESGEVIARNILEAMRAKVFRLPDGQALRCTCCLGFTAFPVLPAEPDAFRWEEAVEIADQCLYAAKNSGRDAWVGVFCDGDRRADGLKPDLLVNVQSVLQSDGFQLRTSHQDPSRLVWKDFNI